MPSAPSSSQHATKRSSGNGNTKAPVCPILRSLSFDWDTFAAPEYTNTSASSA